MIKGLLLSLVPIAAVRLILDPMIGYRRVRILKTAWAKARAFFFCSQSLCGWGESNSRFNIGSVVFYH